MSGTVLDPAATVVAEAEERPIATGRRVVRRVRRSAPREDRVVVLRATALELELLQDELRRIAESACLDARTAALARMRALREEERGWAALALPDARRVRVRLRLERDGLRRDGIGCRHVVGPRR
ncbi:hypothetical protein [Rathayibacter sp. SD072]|uniref:hypothetical protein n=1 Tax=Rathayibacter sp. SD072 TaxID=2781731 RepID=UPI001A959958|nr:hypothetical protein [Rathayibacter sp. SD072]MBO0985233.1 hypothetical protein [Rathayibacter sp. SD072]